ncbi:uncharacterized protein Z518_03150 [Rhinocladiella mackenziei CBS 650.93]|uniref:Uncharacterized protein n=1 Tax=Rhinocladiella mackenziei CBS 650.93 TaxID=1442369 RepID=A0A0D2IRB1_9EURO|nr:uncharacterized protein Z518_03150 [Rhinocladiella mackenziei CBS 650.93]KIX08494.1 hypothetical protein Z518_03150 [Rhinocladiella mackenziei CBS 650.93]
MSGQEDEPPTKRRNTGSKHPEIARNRLLNQDHDDAFRENGINEEEADSSPASSSSGYSPPWRAQQRMRMTHQTRYGDGRDVDDTTDEEETTSSSESSETDDDEISEAEESDEKHDNVWIKGPRVSAPSTLSTTFTGNEGSNLKSRLQNFLPQLQQANAELENAAGLQDQRIDHVSDNQETYIEMNLSLGVLSEQKRGKRDHVRVNDSSTEEEGDADNAIDENEQSNAGGSEDVLARLKGETVSRGAKRKIEELG